ncbi:MAG: hypothetical protein CUR34_03355 [Sediminibacterium sp.]|nr:MAG: hypothetical protein CUR34_03355 [Sediminibacterium sp.] [Sediminibacterium sp. FEMGT703S]
MRIVNAIFTLDKRLLKSALRVDFEKKIEKNHFTLVILVDLLTFAVRKNRKKTFESWQEYVR